VPKEQKKKIEDVEIQETEKVGKKMSTNKKEAAPLAKALKCIELQNL
jgi:hypothetical protein